MATTWILFSLTGREVGRVTAGDRHAALRAARRIYPDAEIAGAREATTDKATRLLAHQDHSWRVRDELVSEIGL